MFWAKYSRIVFKPIALTAMFLIMLIWLYSAFAPIVRESLQWRVRSSVYVESELARLSTLVTFLTGVFRGDLGISFRTQAAVSTELGERLPVTLLLIGLSTALALITEVIAVLIASFWKPTSRKPQSFMHSLRNYLFGLIPFLGFFLILVFAFELNLLPPGHLFPDYWFVYPPQSLLEEFVVRLQYLVLPSLTLALIFLARGIMIVWSGASPILSEGWSKRFLFSCVAIDFTFTISAVVLVEWVFLLHGLGYGLFRSVEFGDYNGMIGFFIALLALAVVLGYVSTLIDFLLRFFGLNEKLERKVILELPPSRKKEESIINGVKGTLQDLFRSRGFMAGFVIVTIFVLFGIFAPLVAPASPVSAYKRDVWGQFAYGARSILALTLPLTISATLIGFTLGFIGGYFEGWADNIVMTLIDAILIVPIIPFMIILPFLTATVWGVGEVWGFSTLWFLLPFLSAIAAYGFRNTYLMRSRNQKLKGIGLKDAFPDLVRDLFSGFSFTMMSLVLLLPAVEALHPWHSQNVSWGSMAHEAWSTAGSFEQWWLWLVPTVSIGLFALGFFLLGSALDKRMK